MKKSILKPMLLATVLLGGIFSQTAGIYEGNQQIAAVKADEVAQGNDIKKPQPFVTIHDEAVHFHSIKVFHRKITDVSFVVHSYSIDSNQQYDKNNGGNQLYDGAKPYRTNSSPESGDDREIDNYMCFRLGRHNTSNNTNWLKNQSQNAILVGENTNIDKVNFAMKGTLTCRIDGARAEFDNVIIAQRKSGLYNRWLFGQQGAVTDKASHCLCAMQGKYLDWAPDPTKTTEENARAEHAILFAGHDNPKTRTLIATIAAGFGADVTPAAIAGVFECLGLAGELTGGIVVLAAIAGMIIAATVGGVLIEKDFSNNFTLG